MSNPSVRIRVEERHVVLDNGILQVTLSRPAGVITGISFNGVDNLMEVNNSEDNRGYWDLVWNEPGKTRTFQRINGTKFTVILEDEDKVEISFTRTWDTSKEGTLVPLNIDKRLVMLRGCYGFYTYAIYEHKEGWPDFDMAETRVVFKLRKDKFHYMAITDDRQRIMPMPDDRLRHRGEELAYPEAVRLINPLNPDLKGEVDDKYQYSIEDKDNKVHGWICSDPPMGFWQITPSDEFRTGGPLKQDLTSHTGPITLAMFVSRHYCGDELMPKFRNGEYWKKVLGPIFVYVNCLLQEGNNNQNSLWEDAKAQMGIEVDNWPYSFPASEDFQKAEDRGSLRGKLLVRDRYVSDDDMPANAAYVGLALPGEVGSWETECKGYQFWTRADDDGSFCISNIRTGDYNLYAWVPGFIGDYRFDENITITSGCDTDLEELLYEPPRDGPTLWEIGVADRSAAEFYVPDPDPNYINKLYVDHPDKFRQYGLWERYAHIYPDEDLVYTIGLSDYKKDWFYAHVTRKKYGSNSYLPTTWKIKYKLDRIIQDSIYKLRMAIASAANAELQIRFNDLIVQPAHFTTGLFGEDNSIARHGIHGQHKLFHVEVKSSWLVEGENTIFLTQTRISSPFQGIMYDYIRLEEPETTEK